MPNFNTNKKNIKIALLAFMFILFITSGCSSLQHSINPETVTSSVKLNSDILIGPGECVLKKFQGTSVNNKFYLYWVFQSNSNQFLFQIESSVNGKNFNPLCFKQGASSPGTATLMLCITDSINKSDVVYYRIKAIAVNFSIKKKIEQEYKDLFNASIIKVTKNQKTKGYMQDDSSTINGAQTAKR
jgi:hypothetical protein